MKPREKCSGRGCESPQVHHKEIIMISYVLFLVFWTVFGVFTLHGRHIACNSRY
jgi:hypothetical protein